MTLPTTTFRPARWPYRCLARGIAIAVLSAAAACSGGNPSGPTLPPRPVPAPAPGAAGTLEISTFTAAASLSSAPGFGSDVRLIVSETSGKGGASILSVVLTTDDGNSDIGCGAGNFGVPPGGTWNIEAMGYCAPTLPSHTAQTVTALVGFINDDLTTGTVRATAVIRR